MGQGEKLSELRSAHSQWEEVEMRWRCEGGGVEISSGRAAVTGRLTSDCLCRLLPSLSCCLTERGRELPPRLRVAHHAVLTHSTPFIPLVFLLSPPPPLPALFLNSSTMVLSFSRSPFLRGSAQGRLHSSCWPLRLLLHAVTHRRRLSHLP